jgi:Protein of unknown function (DUF3108)
MQGSGSNERSRGVDTGRRWRRLGGVSVVALALHAALLAGAQWAWPGNEPPALPMVQVHLVDNLPAAPRVSATPEPPRAVEPISIAMPTPTATPTPAKPKAAPRPVAPRTKATAPVVAPAPPATSPMQLAVAERPVEPAAPAASDEPEAIPHYPTRPPPPMTLRYDVGRGPLHGTGELTWRPGAERYELGLEFRLSGLVILAQSSRGAFDAEGLAPERFTDRRIRRGTTAANFQRAVGKITYSGSSNEFALRAGAQDRLSWMLQLAAIVGAGPQLALPGAKVVMLVTGSRGDADVWSFRCLGAEPVPSRTGAVEAIRFIREPRDAYDTLVQIWLDPLLHHLPVKATQKSGSNDEGYELRLIEAVATN